MVPTSHFRWYSTFGREPWILQQLWAPTLGDETLFMPLEWLEKQGGEWREIPYRIAPPKEKEND